MEKQMYELDFNFNIDDYIEKDDIIYKILDIDESCLLPVYNLENMNTHEKKEFTFINLASAIKIDFKEY